MKAIKATIFASVISSALSKLALVDRLQEYEGKPIVHREYREDTQTLQRGEDGQYVVHVKSVVGTQDDDGEPVFDQTENDYPFPIDTSYKISAEDQQMNQWWNDLWDETGPFVEPKVETIETPFEPLPPAALPLQQVQDSEWTLDDPEWQLADWWKPSDAQADLDALLREDSDVVLPDVVNTAPYQAVDDSANYPLYYGVMKWDGDKWTVDKKRYEQLGLKPFGDSQEEIMDGVQFQLEEEAADEELAEAISEMERAEEEMVEEVIEEEEKEEEEKKEEQMNQWWNDLWDEANSFKEQKVKTPVFGSPMFKSLDGEEPKW